MTDPVKIDIYGPQSKISGMYPKELIRSVTSYPVQGAQFSKAYRKGVWDGRKHLLNARTGAFPTGLVKIVRNSLEDAGIPVELEDHRVVPVPTETGFDLQGGFSFTYPYDYQLDACQKMVEAKQGIVKIATNGGKTSLSAAVVQYLGLKTLFVVSSRELLYQAQKVFMQALGLTENEIGVVGDGCWAPGSFVTIGMLPTLEARLSTPECRDLLKETEVLFFDECHHCGSESWYSVATLCPAYYRYGLSGTPLDRTDGANLRLIAATGEVIVNIENKFLVERGISARAHIIWDKITEPVLKKGIRYPTAYKQGVVENPQLLKRVIDWTETFREANLGVLILCEEIAHGKLIDEALWTDSEVFVPHQFIYGDEDSEVRKQALESFSNGTLPVLIASTILDEGVDVPTIDALILAGSRKSRIRTMQRLGRGLRGKKLIVVEFANFCNKYLLQHSYERLQDYKSEECFPIHYSSPDLDLVNTILSKEENSTSDDKNR